ncbi:MAG: hypothetical protein BM557_02060 [Flavobacterium sp. MedPE-SWcel]|uniref:hypothetical protein n=1 Tax=uncultured Flavobacterium sp. TaxID=165435 RepID=UPI00091804B3|nr:hypothetical protein [uncultured Flavobacterium sp.]OIQ22182.1 MAG: hypothetical protein BM557_02060 [Flavobacterium sp. MedPE-SWcel]
MIYVDRSKAAIPKVIKGINSRGDKERKKAIAHYTGKNRNQIFKFSVYRDRSIKEALIELFLDKCAYCESKVSHVYSGDIEHFRPKGKIAEATNPKPGYYWLASDWDNLLFSCRNCNQKLTHQIHGSIDKITKGKMDQFPLSNETHRVRVHDNPNGIQDEERYRLIINPCIENPEDHFEYDTSHAVIKPKMIDGVESIMAKHSIEVYVLQRVPLVLTREKVLISILAQVQRVKEAVLNVNNNLTSDTGIQFYYNEILKRELKILKQFTSPKEEYSAMAKQIVNEFLSNSFNIKKE